MELLKELILLGIGAGCGWLIARAKTFSDYNDMYSHLTCEIISRMTRAMRSLCMEQEDIDRVIQRMGCKLMPPACPRPPVPPSKDLEEESKCKQKPVDKVEPTFHEGEWVILTAGELSITLQIVKVDTNKKRYWFNDSTYLPIVEEECLHLWTIEDAKDGDVLACENGWTCIFKTLVNDKTFSSYCFMDNTKWFCETGSESHTLEKAFIKAYNGNIYPATKEQRDNLEKAMADAGYAFDFEKKELKKIEQKPTEWSEDDQSNFCELSSFIFETYRAEDASRLITWFKSLKERIQPDKGWIPIKESFYTNNVVLAQKKDKSDVWEGYTVIADHTLDPLVFERYINIENISTQSLWKPSDEQIKAVKLARSFVVDDFDEHPALSEILIELEEQLKKLKEE